MKLQKGNCADIVFLLETKQSTAESQASDEVEDNYELVRGFFASTDFDEENETQYAGNEIENLFQVENSTKSEDSSTDSYSGNIPGFIYSIN